VTDTVSVSAEPARPAAADTVATDPATAVSAPTSTARRRVRRLAPSRRVPYARLLGPALLLLVWSVANLTGTLDPRTRLVELAAAYSDGASAWFGFSTMPLTFSTSVSAPGSGSTSKTP